MKCMKRLNCILVALALIIGGSAVAQIQIPGGPIKPPVPPAKQRTKPKKQANPKKAAQATVKYYDVTFTCNAPDADLYIDDDYVGDANTIQALKAGLHTVRVFTDYYNNFSTTINVSSNNSVDLPLTEKTDAESQYQLGINYYEGRSGFPQDYTQAAKRFLNAANKGDAEAQNWTGYCYHHGHGMEQSDEQAAKWYQKAANQGLAAAQNNIGYCYMKGLGVKHDDAEGLKWYLKAAEQGYAEAQNNLGDYYLTQNDRELALKWFSRAASQGDAMGQFNLGFCYERGIGVDADFREAFKLFKQAAEQGNADAQHWLGYCYEEGYGTSRSDDEAAKWYQKAVDQGVVEAQKGLDRIEKRKNATVRITRKF